MPINNYKHNLNEPLQVKDLVVNGTLSNAGVSTLSNISGTNINVTGIITAVSFRGDGSQLTGVSASGSSSGGVSISTNTTNANQLISYATSFGSTTGLGATNIFVFNPSSGSVGIGTTNPVSTLTVTGSGTSTSQLYVSGVSTFINGPVLIGTGTSTGTAAQKLQITGGAYISTSTGIGTTNPAQALHVLGNLLVASGSSTGQYITQKAYELNSGTLSWEGTAGQLFSITNNLTSGSIFSVNDVSGIPSIDVNADGTITLAPYGINERVGIGTTLPTSKLHVVGNALITGVSTVSNLRITPVGTGATVGLSGIVTYYGDGSQLTGISGGISISTNTTNSNQYILYATSFGSTTGLGATNIFVFNPSSGSVGIGTTLPTSKLYVVGDNYVTGVVTAASGIRGIGIYSGGNLITSGIITALNFVGTGNTFAVVGNRVDISIASGSGGGGAGAGGTSGQIQFNSGGISTGANYFNYDNTTARVGIGTSVPTARLSVASTTTGASLLVVNDNLSDGAVFRVNDNNANVLMDVDANGTIIFPTSGNVGIGTTIQTPTSKLQVNGDVLISGIVTASNFYTSGIVSAGGTISGGNIFGLNIVGTSLSISGGINTLGTFKISSGIVSATSGVITYYGDGSKLTGILTSGSAGGSTGQVQFNSGGNPTGANYFNYDSTTAKVGIGTSLPSARLSVASTTTGTSLLVVNDNLSDGAVFRVNDNNANVLMDVDANGTIIFPTSGNVGIGTTIQTPTSKLQVNGDVLISGIVTATTFLGSLTGTAVTVTTGIITNIVATAATIGTIKIASGIITANSGVITYYGSGAFLTGIVTSGAAGQGASGQIQFNDGGPLGGASFFHYDKTTTKVGIGTSLPSARLSVASTTTGASLLVVNDNLSDGAVFRVNDNNANVLMDVDANGTIIFPTSGNIGIGTTIQTPTSKLQINGDVLVSGVVTSSSQVVGTAVTINISGINLSGIVTASAGIITNITSVNQSFSGITTTQRLNVGTGGTIIATTTTGLVGIGTSVPTARLNVSAPSSGTSLMLVNDNLSDGAVFRVNDNNANVLMDVDANGTIIFPTSGNVGIGTTLQTPLAKLQVDGVSYFNGSVGIGTTNPTSPLTVIGNTRIVGVTTITGNLNASGNYYVKIARLTNQTITTATDTLIGFSTITDPNSWYTGSNNRTTPTVSGTYHVQAMLNWQAGATTNANQSNIQLRKNATTFAISIVGIQTFQYSQFVCGIVTMNGSTDYIDFTAYTSNATSQTVTGDAGGAYTKIEIHKIN